MSRTLIFFICFLFTQSSSKSWKGKKVLNCQSYSVPVYQVTCTTDAPIVLYATPYWSAYEYDDPPKPSPDAIYYPGPSDTDSSTILHKTYKVTESTDEESSAVYNTIYTYNKEDKPEPATSVDSNKYNREATYNDVTNRGPVVFENFNNTVPNDQEIQNYTELTYYNGLPKPFLKVNNAMSDDKGNDKYRDVSFNDVSYREPVVFENFSDTVPNDKELQNYKVTYNNVPYREPIPFQNINNVMSYEEEYDQVSPKGPTYPDKVNNCIEIDIKIKII